MLWFELFRNVKNQDSQMQTANVFIKMTNAQKKAMGVPRTPSSKLAIGRTNPWLQSSDRSSQINKRICLEPNGISNDWTKMSHVGHKEVRDTTLLYYPDHTLGIRAHCRVCLKSIQTTNISWFPPSLSIVPIQQASKGPPSFPPPSPIPPSLLCKYSDYNHERVILRKWSLMGP